VGASTARLIQSHLKTDDLRTAIATGDALRLKSVKGVGAKTAERIIIDLRDKVLDLSTENLTLNTATLENKLAQDALAALEVLGYNRFQTQKIIDKIVKEEAGITLEGIIKKALKNF
jgi:Holliday junction DNA helicase RuvA